MTVDDAVLVDYALGTLPRAQVEEVELFLRAHPDSAGRVRRIQDELAQLVLSLPGETVSRASEDALLDRLRRHRQPPVETGSKRAAEDRPSYRWAAFGLAAALGLAAWLALGPFSSSGRVERQVARYQAEPGALSTRLVTPDGAEIGTLVRLNDDRLFVAFEEVPASGVYQLWEIRDGSAESLAVVEGRISLTAPVADGSLFAVTLEPAGGSDRPTSDPLVRVPL
jgi:anti-sigma-K factor RskA